MQKIEITADTPLSALFRNEHHEILRDVIDTWRSALIGLTEEEALEMNSFFFDFDWIRPIEVYMDLTNLIINDGLLTTMSQLAHYMAIHSNLSKSEATLYALLKRYKRICQDK